MNESAIAKFLKKIGKIYCHFDDTLLYYKKRSENSTNKENLLNESKLKRNLSNREISKDTLKDLENFHFERRHLDQAFYYLKIYLAEQRRICRVNDISVCDSYQILANISFEKQDYNLTLEYYLKLLSSQLKRTRIDQSKLSNIYTAIGTIFLMKNSLDQALIY